MNLKIAFDLDGIFIGSPIFIPKSIIERLYKKSDRRLSYRIPGAVEKYIRIASHQRYLRPPIVKNINALNSFNKENGIDVYLISSRFSFLKDKTEDWIRLHRLKVHFRKMFFNYDDEQPHIFKERILRETDIDKFVDDDFDLLFYLSRRNPNISFYWVSPRGFQKKLPENLVRVKDVNEFKRKYV